MGGGGSRRVMDEGRGGGVGESRAIRDYHTSLLDEMRWGAFRAAARICRVSGVLRSSYGVEGLGNGGRVMRLLASENYHISQPDDKIDGEC